MAGLQNFIDLGLPSEIHFQREKFQEWYATIAFTHPRTIERTAQGTLLWTKEEAFAWYDEQLVMMEKMYKQMYEDHVQWKMIDPLRTSLMTNFPQRQPGPLPPYKTRVYVLNDYLEKYPEQDVLPPPLQRTLSHDQQALEEAMEKADQCKEGDTILSNYFIPFSSFSEEFTITYSFLTKIDGKMKDTTATCLLNQFNTSLFTFDTSGYQQNEQFCAQICAQINGTAV